MSFPLLAMDSFTSILPSNTAEDYPSPENSEEDAFNNVEGLDDSPEDGQKRRRGKYSSTAEKRATHNAVERARRESLNGRFMELAAILPNMHSVKRPSKSAIVNKSLEYVQASQAREQALLAQNEALRTEVNELRVRLGMPPLTSPGPNTAAALPALSNKISRKTSIASNGSKSSSNAGTNATTSPVLSQGNSDSPTNSIFDLAHSPMPKFPPQLNMPPAAQAIPERRISAPTDANVGVTNVQQMPVLPPAQNNLASFGVPANNLGLSAIGTSDLSALLLNSIAYNQQMPAQLSGYGNVFNTGAMQTGYGSFDMPAWRNSFPSQPMSVPAGTPDSSWLFA